MISFASRQHRCEVGFRWLRSSIVRIGAPTMTKDPYLGVEPLGSRIRRLRQEQGLTQDGLSLKARVDQSSLSKIERLAQRPWGPVPLTRLAKTLGLTVDELVEGTDYRL